MDDTLRRRYLEHIVVMRDRDMGLRAIINDIKWHRQTKEPVPNYEEVD